MRHRSGTKKPRLTALVVILLPISVVQYAAHALRRLTQRHGEGAWRQVA